MKPYAVWKDLPCGCSTTGPAWIFQSTCVAHFYGPRKLSSGDTPYQYGPVRVARSELPFPSPEWNPKWKKGAA
jgi:hypothetical protein